MNVPKPTVPLRRSQGETMNETCAEMPRYQSHKIVHALKIVGLSVEGRDGAVLGDCSLWMESDPAEGFAPILLSPEYVAKHQPKVGGYYVVYEDGYASWSPGDVFEAGYTRISPKEEVTGTNRTTVRCGCGLLLREAVLSPIGGTPQCRKGWWWDCALSDALRRLDREKE